MFGRHGQQQCWSLCQTYFNPIFIRLISTDKGQLEIGQQTGEKEFP